MRYAFAALALLTVSPAVADALPHFTKGAPNTAVRKRLIAVGYKLYRAPDADTCNQDAQNCRLPEKETCSELFPGCYPFNWEKDQRHIFFTPTGDPSNFESIDTWERLRQ